MGGYGFAPNVCFADSRRSRSPCRSAKRRRRTPGDSVDYEIFTEDGEENSDDDWVASDQDGVRLPSAHAVGIILPPPGPRNGKSKRKSI
jgi:hypothetical protein